MTAKNKTTLKGYFNTGDRPSESNFADLIDTIGSLTLTVAANNASDASKGRADYVCDGTADDVEIQAALDALPATGGVVQLSEGLFTTTSAIDFTDNSGSSLVGAGMEATKIKLANGANCNIIYSNPTTEHYFNGVHYMTLDGNRANQTSGIGVFLDGGGGGEENDWRMDHTFVYSTKGRLFDTYHTWGMKVSRCYFEYSDETSIAAVFLRNTTEGTFTDTRFSNAPNTSMIYCLSKYMKFIGCEIALAGQHGIWLGGRHYQSIIGCTIHNNNQGGGAYDNVFIEDDYVRIIGNNIGAVSDNGDARYGVNLTVGTQNCIVEGNIITDYDTAGVLDAGANNIVRGNNGWITENEGAAASIADGGTIAHGCSDTPTVAVVSGSVAGEIITVSGIDGTNITVDIKDNDGSAGTTQTIYWRAYV